MARIKLGKARIAQNRYDNWYGYLGARRVEQFFHTSCESQEEAARRWLGDREWQAQSLLAADFALSATVED